MNIVFKSLRDSFRSIKENKLFFFLLIIMEIAFVLISSLVLVYYSAQIFEYAKPVFEPLKNYEGGEVADLYDDTTEVLESYSALKLNIFMFLLISFIIYLVLNGVNWDLANLIAVKRDFLIYPIKFWMLTIIFLIPIALVIRFLTAMSISSMVIGPYIWVAGVLILIFLYFMKISYTFAVRYELKEIFTKTLKNAFVYGIKKIHIYVITFLIMMAFCGLSFYLIYLSKEANVLLLTGSIIFFILVLSWSKVYLMTTTCNIIKCK